MLHFGHWDGLVPWHLHGHTQHKTLHARLSEDVSARPEGSKFFRTAPGQFFLKSLRDDLSIPQSFKGEYRAPPRKKELKREPILAIRALALLSPEAKHKILPLQRVIECLKSGDYAFRYWRQLESSHDFLPVHSFVVVHRANEVLSFRSGKFKPDSDPIFGARSIGFGGAVFASDVDMMFDSFFGIIGNGINELVRGLGLTRRMAEESRYRGRMHAHFATEICGKTALRYLHVVLSYRCPDEFAPTKSTLALRDLRWISAAHLANDLENYDSTSRLLFEKHKIGQIAGTQAAPNGNARDVHLAG